ncbi:MAG TPA: hypothetical protein VGX28_00245 [Frankiaceae bacterium]|jgi:hypothetical protein|nr:hypothetical protein [Frankiaceae bacterium]
MRTPGALAAAALVAAGLAMPAAAAPGPKPKPVGGSYDVLIPVPYPMEASSGSHCADAPDTLSRDVRTMGLKSSPGRLDLRVSGFAGDWVIEVFDAKGRVVATGASLDLTSGERKATYKKKRSGTEALTVMVCNFGGTASGTVAWTFTPA